LAIVVADNRRSKQVSLAALISTLYIG